MDLNGNLDNLTSLMELAHTICDDAKRFAVITELLFKPSNVTVTAYRELLCSSDDKNQERGEELLREYRREYKLIKVNTRDNCIIEVKRLLKLSDECKNKESHEKVQRSLHSALELLEKPYNEIIQFDMAPLMEGIPKLIIMLPKEYDNILDVIEFLENEFNDSE